jgi:diguanylate cyclase (GGDEF)-like protein
MSLFPPLNPFNGHIKSDAVDRGDHASRADYHGHTLRPHAPETDAVDPGYWPRAMSLRVIIAACYVALIPAGLLPMSTAWWIISGWSLLLYAVAVLAIYYRCGVLRLHSDVTPFTDTLMVTLAIVALARPDYPIWIGYFLIIMSLATFHTTRYMAAFALSTIALYWAGLLILHMSARAPIAWQLASVVSIMAVFMALNADVISESNRKLRDMVRKASLTDPLTGLDNRRRFREILDSHTDAEPRPLAVLMYDLDNFKNLNEEFGHVRADAVLVRVADELRASFREADTVARYGGDEIVVLAHVLSLDHAVAIAERSIARINDLVGVTMSVGVSVYPVTSTSIDGALREADDALGTAKRAGKARVAASPARGAA